jgi:hypothetical protein
MGQSPRLFSISISSPLTPLPHPQNVPKKDCRVGRAAKNSNQSSVKNVLNRASLVQYLGRKGEGAFYPKEWWTVMLGFVEFHKIVTCCFFNLKKEFF